MKIEDMVREFEATQRQVEASKARRKPDANRLTLVTRAAKTYSYWIAGEDARGYRVRFCVAHHINVAGYVLTWKQVEGRTRKNAMVLKRSQWAALKTRDGAMNIARKRSATWRAKRGLAGEGEYSRVGY